MSPNQGPDIFSPGPDSILWASKTHQDTDIYNQYPAKITGVRPIAIESNLYLL